MLWCDRCLYVCMHACMHACMYARMRGCMCACMRARMHATPSARRLAPHSTPRTYDSCCHGSKPRGAHRRAGIPLRAPLRRTHHAASLAVTCGISPQPCRRWRAASTPRDNISLPMHTPHARTHTLHATPYFLLLYTLCCGLLNTIRQNPLK